MPRIIAGCARKTRLLAPANRLTRPTADRVKEALFSILQQNWPPDAFLDLFSGTGQIGLEAASRGARKTICVENSPAGVRMIEENLRRTHLESTVCLMRRDAVAAVRQLVEKKELFDIVFADPPYDQVERFARALSPYLANLVQPDGIVVFEHDARLDIRPFVTNLQFARCCQYGTAMLSFYTGRQL